MAWIKEITEGEAEGHLHAVYEDIAGPGRRAAKVLKGDSRHPEALRDHIVLYRTLMFGDSPLTRAERYRLPSGDRR